MRERRHPRPLPTTGRACAWLLGGRSALGEGVAVTEEEWLTATYPRTMLTLLKDRASSRKLICFFLAFWPDYTSYTTDGLEEGVGSDLDFRPPWLDVGGPDDDALPPPHRCWVWALLMTHPDSPWKDKTPQQAAATLLRELFGNPFRPVTLDPSWLTSTVTALAQHMYDNRDFSAMPILADALQDAGCDSDDILNHCRQPGEHVRGCWVVDLVLGKE